MNPPTTWDEQLGYALLLAPILLPPIAALAAIVWLTRKAITR